MNSKKQSLHVDESVYLKAFENSGIYAKLDSLLNITYANRQFCQIMHTTKQKVKNTNLSFFLMNDPSEIIEIIKCKQSWEGTQVFMTCNSEEIHLSCSFIPIFDKDDSLSRFFS